jgi:ethanolamine utilization protein EutP (predicted NTPase)
MKRMDFFAISAVTGTGVEDLVKYLTREVEARLWK